MKRCLLAAVLAAPALLSALEVDGKYVIVTAENAIPTEAKAAFSFCNLASPRAEGAFDRPVSEPLPMFCCSHGWILTLYFLEGIP